LTKGQLLVALTLKGGKGGGKLQRQRRNFLNAGEGTNQYHSDSRRGTGSGRYCIQVKTITETTDDHRTVPPTEPFVEGTEQMW